MDIKLFGFKTEHDRVERNAQLHFDSMCLFNHYAKNGLIFKNRLFQFLLTHFYFFMEFYFKFIAKFDVLKINKKRL
jgi:hypothetical protein